MENERKPLNQIFNNPKPDRSSLDDIFGVSSVPPEVRPASRFQSHLEPFSQQETEDRPGLGRRAFDAVTGGVQKFGESIAAPIAARGEQARVDDITEQYQRQGDELIRASREAVERGDEEAIQNLNQALEQHIERGKELPQVADLVPAIEKSARQVIGEAVETGVMALSGGLLTSGARAATGRVTGGLVRQSAGFGGTLGGASAAQQEEASAGTIVGGAVVGAGLGAATAGAIQGGGAMVRRIGSMRADSLARTQELNRILSDPSTPLSQRLAARAGDQPFSAVAAKDKGLKEAIRQGIEPAHAFIAKHSDTVTKGQMSKMLQIAKKRFQVPGPGPRSTDVVGESFLKRANHVELQRQQIGKQLDAVAEGLRGQQVNVRPAIERFKTELSSQNVRIADDGTLVFQGSNFEGITGAQRAIKQVWERANRVGDDAYASHQMKRYIDNIVDYGKTKDGITGNAERLIKGLRSGVDEALDTTFGQYNSVNQRYSEAITLRNRIEKYVGKDIFSDSAKVSARRVGLKLRATMSDREVGANITEVMDQVENYGRSTGLRADDDLVSMMAFSDVLEDMFGPQAATGLQKEVAKSFREGVKQKFVGEMVGSTFNLQGIRTAIGKGIEAARGINHQNAVRSLEALLN